MGLLGGFHPSVLWYVGLSHLVSRGCGPTVRDEQRISQFIDQTLSLVHHYYKIHGRCSDALLSPAVECATLTEDPYPGRKLPFTGDMLAQAIIYHRARQSVGDHLISLAFRCGFSHLLRAFEYLNPSGSRLFRHCILAKYVVFQYRTVEGEMKLVSGAVLRSGRYYGLRVYCKIAMYCYSR